MTGESHHKDLALAHPAHPARHCLCATRGTAGTVLQHDLLSATAASSTCSFTKPFCPPDQELDWSGWALWLPHIPVSHAIAQGPKALEEAE